MIKTVNNQYIYNAAKVFSVDLMLSISEGLIPPKIPYSGTSVQSAAALIEKAKKGNINSEFFELIFVLLFYASHLFHNQGFDCAIHELIKQNIMGVTPHTPRFPQYLTSPRLFFHKSCQSTSLVPYDSNEAGTYTRALAKRQLAS